MLFRAERITTGETIEGYYWSDNMDEMHYIMYSENVQSSHKIHLYSLEMQVGNIWIMVSEIKDLILNEVKNE